jgi:exopolysaccharide biosynthesis protein
MRRLPVIALLLVATAANAQVRTWEKLVSPGLMYRMEIDVARPAVMHALRWTPNAQTAAAQAVLANGTVFSTDPEVSSREDIEAMVLRTKAVAGINADFFPWTGDPLGAMVRNGELLSTPDTRRPVFAWSDANAVFGHLKFAGKVLGPDDVTLFISGVNQSCQEDQLILNTEAAGEARSEKDTEAMHLVLELTEPLQANGTIKVTTKHLVGDLNNVRIGPGEAVITAVGKQAASLIPLAGGKELEIVTSILGTEGDEIQHVVSGGPTLLVAGELSTNFEEEGFSEKFAETRHPRTAVGRTAAGDIWLVVIDGRQEGISSGATLTELTETMVSLGCTDAINLDGGGSSTLALNGVVLNRPSDPKPRPVSNGILLFSDNPFEIMQADPEMPAMVIQGRALMTTGEAGVFKVIDSKGNEVPNSQVLWSAHGSAWVDQGGRVKAMAEGESVVRAAVRGHVLEVTVTIEPPTSG